MSNKRIIELAPLNPAHLADDDLFAVSDVSVPETKKITAEDFALWVANSASISIDSASYSDTASFLIFRGMGVNSNGTASFSISASWAALAYSASFVISASYAITSSYSLTASHVLNFNSGAFSFATASFLLYNGYPNGTASNALTSSHALRAVSSSFAITSSFSMTIASASHAITASYSITSSRASSSVSAASASFLVWTGVSNGSASWANTVATASEAARVRSITDSNLYREWGPLTSSIIGTTAEAKTASFGLVQVTGSGAKIIVEAWGTVWVSQSSDINFSGSVLLFLSESVTAATAAYFELNQFIVQNYYTGSDVALASHFNTGSMIVPFYLKGSALNPGAALSYDISVRARNSRFITGSATWQGVRCSLKVNNDTVFVPQ
jgi:hypothetical protein